MSLPYQKFKVCEGDCIRSLQYVKRNYKTWKRFEGIWYTVTRLTRTTNSKSCDNGTKLPHSKWVKWKKFFIGTGQVYACSQQIGNRNCNVEERYGRTEINKCSPSLSFFLLSGGGWVGVGGVVFTNSMLFPWSEGWNIQHTLIHFKSSANNRL